VALTETKQGARFFGSARFIVRGRLALPENLEQVLRPRINEYPERFPILPAFPAPGERTGSPGRSTVARPEGAPGEEGGAPGGAPSGEVIPAETVYPSPRNREPSNQLNAGGTLPAPSSPAASAIQMCAGSGGIHMQRANGLGTMAVDAQSSVQFSRPFIVRFVSFWSDTLDPANIQGRFLLSGNNDVSGGFNSDGVQLDEGAIGQADFAGITALQTSFPNKIWTAVPAFVKLVVRNNTAGTINFQWVANLEWLD
jgi:hypothetical protein